VLLRHAQETRDAGDLAIRVAHREGHRAAAPCSRSIRSNQPSIVSGLGTVV
jgi:hypothetical protein